jgi:hypothetical protein
VDTPSKDDVAAAFPLLDQPIRPRSGHDGLAAELAGRTWPDVADPERFWEIESDPVTWMALPNSLFTHFLPAMLTVALTGTGAATGNLRGLLYLEMRKGSPRRRFLEKEGLTPSQLRLLERFLVLVKHGRLAS